MWTERSHERCLGVVMCLLAAAGCAEREPQPHPAARGELARLDTRARSASAGEVVARVEGAVITRAAFEAAWREHPEWTRAQVLDALIARELVLARAGDASGGDALGGELSFARKRGLFRALLDAEVVEAAAQPPDERALAAEHALLARPRGARATHLLVLLPEGAPQEIVDRAEGIARSLRAELGDEPSREDIQRLREQHRGEHSGFELVVNAGVEFPFDPPARRDLLPERWGVVAPPFAQAAQALADRGEVGHLTELVRTQFGWHVILLEEVYPAVDPARDEALHAQALARVRTMQRQRRYVELASEVVAQSDWYTYPDVLLEDETGRKEQQP